MKTQETDLFDLIPTALFVLSGEGSIQEVNPAGRSLTGYTADELLDSALNRLLSVDFDDLLRIENLLEKGQSAFTCMLTRKDGEKLFVKVHLQQYGTQFIITLADLTEFKRYEAELQAIQDSSNRALMFIDPGGSIRMANRLSQQNGALIFGRAPQIGDSIYDFVLPEDRAGFDANFARALNGERVALDKCMPGPSGEVYFEFCYHPVRDMENMLIGVMFSAENITERYHASDELRKFKRAVEQSSSSVVITDTSGSIVYVNPKFTRLTGYRLEEAIGQNPRILKSGFSPPEVYEEMWQTITGGGEWHGEFLNKKKNGEFYWELASISPIWNSKGEITHYIAVKEDITRRKEAEHALRQSENRYRMVVEDQTEVICRYLPGDYRLTFINGAGYTYFAGSRESLVGRSLLELLPAEAHERFLTHMQSLSPEVPVMTFEHETRALDGSVRYEQWTDRAFFDGSGQVVEYQSVGRDITDRKQALEREMALSLERQRHTILTEFIRHAGHEFRTPLSTIATATYVLANASPEVRQKQMDKISRQIFNIQRLVDSMLLMTELNEIAELERKPVQVNELIEMEARQLSAKLDSRRIELKQDPAVPLIQVDEELLAIAIKELLENALRFTPPDGLITVYTAVQDSMLCITVQDTGPGIEPAALSRIFETFYREDVARTTPGFGLGLSIALRIVELHGGEIPVESETGQGARFTIRLPL